MGKRGYRDEGWSFSTSANEGHRKFPTMSKEKRKKFAKKKNSREKEKGRDVAGISLKKNLTHKRKREANNMFGGKRGEPSSD